MDFNLTLFQMMTTLMELSNKFKTIYDTVIVTMTFDILNPFTLGVIVNEVTDSLGCITAILIYIYFKRKPTDTFFKLGQL